MKSIGGGTVLEGEPQQQSCALRNATEKHSGREPRDSSWV